MSRSSLNTTGIIATVLLVIVLLPAGYMGAYYAMLKESQIPWHNLSLGSVAVYHANGTFVTQLFWPANKIDRRLRKDYWACPSPNYMVD